MPATQELIKKISNEDEGAFNELFAQYWGKLYNYAFTFSKSRELSIEATQDVFIKIWTRRALLQEISNFESYLFTTARNTIVDSIKANLKVYIENEEIEDLALEEADQPDILFTTKELNGRLNAVIETLPPIRKKVFKLHRLDGMTYEEIGQLLNISKNTVKEHIKLSLKHIRLILQDEKFPAIIILILLKKF